MKYKAIMFDLDGTLLPMNQEEFTGGYFKELAKVLIPLGVDGQKLVPVIWAGTKDMAKNDGTCINKDRFWNRFREEMENGAGTDVDVDKCMEATDAFYGNEFHQAKKFTGENPLAKEAVSVAREKCEKVVLATNPIFPMVGQESRLSWIGLTGKDFDLVTSYETECFSKPNPEYYKRICQKTGLQPEECLMIGNDVKEDMLAAKAAGMDSYLVTDYQILDSETVWEGKQGTFREMIEMLRSLS